MAKLKVQDLPKEEQEKLIHEANAVGLRGMVTAWGVETLQAKIAEAKANKGGEQNPGNDEQKAGNDEHQTGENEQKPGEDEQTGENVNAENLDTDGQGEGEQNAENETPEGTPGENNEPETPDTDGQNENSELPPETPGDVKAFLNGETDKTPEGTEEISEDEAAKLQNEAPAKNVKNGICHICRSEVIDGKCTGCGFEVKK